MPLKINFEIDNPGEFYYEESSGKTGAIKNVISVTQDPATIHLTCYNHSIGHYSHLFYKHELDFWRFS